MILRLGKVMTKMRWLFYGLLLCDGESGQTKVVLLFYDHKTIGR